MNGIACLWSLVMWLGGKQSQLVKNEKIPCKDKGWQETMKIHGSD